MLFIASFLDSVDFVMIRVIATMSSPSRAPRVYFLVDVLDYL
jgi:hypothetical protein